MWGDGPPPLDGALVEVATVNDLPLAHVMRSVLAAEGVASHLFDLGFSGLLGGGYPGIRLMVAAPDEARARRALELPAD